MIKFTKIGVLGLLAVLLCGAPLIGGEAIAQRTANNFTIPDGTAVVAVLNRELSTKTAQDGDRFTARVTSPARYRGAVISGTVSGANRGGRVQGRSGMTLDFDRIRMNGRSYDFAGTVESVRTPNGQTVRVDNEGSVEEGESRGSTTAKRSGIGAAAGAVIGAIAGGGKGAAIGAVVGGGAGAGSVYAQGTDDLEMRAGTRMTIRASAPR